jgi:hypothetical protein
VAIKREIIADIESSKLQTAEQIVQAWTAKTKAVGEEAEADRNNASHDSIDKRFFAAWRISRRYMLQYYSSQGSLWGIYLWSKRLAEAEIARHDTDKERIDSHGDHLERMRDVQFDIRLRTAAGRFPGIAYLEADNYVAEAELLVARARSWHESRTPPLDAATTYLASARIASDWYWEGIDYGHQALMAKLPGPYYGNMPYLANAYEWAERQLDAEWATNTNNAARLAAAKAYREQISQLEKVAKDLVKIEKAPQHVSADAAYHRANAEFMVLTVQKEKPDSKKALSEAAKRLHDAAEAAYHADRRADAQGIYGWSLRWEKAALAVATTKTERIAAIDAHLKRLTDLHKQTKELYDAGRLPSYLLWATEYYLADTEIELGQAKKE